MDMTSDVEEFELLAAKLAKAHRDGDVNVALAGLLERYGEPLQRVLTTALAMKAEKV
jgi:hypothetical protein